MTVLIRCSTVLGVFIIRDYDLAADFRIFHITFDLKAHIRSHSINTVGKSILSLFDVLAAS